MEKTIFIILCFFLMGPHFLNAQENAIKAENGKIGITFSSFGENDVIRFSELDGGPGYNSDYYYVLGVIYVHPLNKWLEVETGIEYLKHSILVQPNLPPDMDNSPEKENFVLFDIPVILRANFLKYFFVNGGLIVDIDGTVNSPIDNQTGIGILLGVSVKYDFDFGISAFVNPYTKMHSLLPFGDMQHHQRVLENGVRVGLTYNLRKVK